MSSLIEQTLFPRTRESIQKDLQELGMVKGMTVLVHSSLSSIGWVNGGAVALIQALMDVVTDEGTIIMPTQSADLSDPSDWYNPPIPWEWWETVRQTMPAYDPLFTPTFGMGRVAELFRTYPGVKRSEHPNVSFAAWGKNRDHILIPHQIENGLGEESPLGRMYAMDAHVLFIGTGYITNTCFHLAEYRSRTREYAMKWAPVFKDEKPVWVEYQDLVYDDEQFEEVGEKFENSHPVMVGHVGSGVAKLFSMKKAVDYAENEFRKIEGAVPKGG